MLLGLFEVALFPSLAFLVLTAYTGQQQGKRIAILYGSSALSGTFAGLFAYAIQLMGTRAGLAPWCWLFIIEGCISLAVGLTLFMTLPCDFQKAWFLSVEERALMMTRTQRDAASNTQQRFEWNYVKLVSDSLLWIASMALFCSNIPLFGFGASLPTIIEGLGLLTPNSGEELC